MSLSSSSTQSVTLSILLPIACLPCHIFYLCDQYRSVARQHTFTFLCGLCPRLSVSPLAHHRSRQRLRIWTRARSLLTRATDAHDSSLPTSHTPARPIHAHPSVHALFDSVDHYRSRHGMTRLSGIPPDPRYVDIIAMDRLNRGEAASDLSLERRGQHIVKDTQGPPLTRARKLPPLRPTAPVAPVQSSKHRHSKMTGPPQALRGGVGAAPQHATIDDLTRRLRTTEFEMISAPDSNAYPQPRSGPTTTPVSAPAHAPTTAPPVAPGVYHAYPTPPRGPLIRKIPDRRSSEHPAGHEYSTTTTYSSGPASTHSEADTSTSSGVNVPHNFESMIRKIMKKVDAEKAEKTALAAATAPRSPTAVPKKVLSPIHASVPNHSHAVPLKSAMHDPSKPSIHAAGAPISHSRFEVPGATQSHPSFAIGESSSGRSINPDPVAYPEHHWFRGTGPVHQPGHAPPPQYRSMGHMGPAMFGPSPVMLPHWPAAPLGFPPMGHHMPPAPWGPMDRQLYDYFQHPDPHWDLIQAWAHDFCELSDPMPSYETPPPSSAWDESVRDEIWDDAPQSDHRFSIARAGPQMWAAQQAQREQYPAPGPVPPAGAARAPAHPEPTPAFDSHPQKKSGRVSRAEWDAEMARLIGRPVSTRAPPAAPAAAQAGPTTSRSSSAGRAHLNALFESLEHDTVRKGKTSHITIQSPPPPDQNQYVDATALHRALDDYIAGKRRR